MAFDGIVISGLVHELNQTILNAKISKIAQPENDELLLTCKGSNGQFRVSISASASLPFLYLTSENKPSPLTAPTFCMVMRKHVANGRITHIYQPYGTGCPINRRRNAMSRLSIETPGRAQTVLGNLHKDMDRRSHKSLVR